MSLMFSKVTLTADDGSTVSFLCSGCPKEENDLVDWVAFQKFMSETTRHSVKAEVETYLYGEGEVFIANAYEVAAFTDRGEKFLHHPDVHLHCISEFTVYSPVVKNQNDIDFFDYI